MTVKCLGTRRSKSMKWISIAQELPKTDLDVLLRSKDNRWFTGKYQGNGSFRIISKCELQEDGKISQLTTSCHSSYFTHWMVIESASMERSITLTHWFVHDDRIGNIFEDERGNRIIVFDGTL